MLIKPRGTILAFLTLLVSTAFVQLQLNKAEVTSADIAIESLPMKLGDWQGKDTEGLDIRSQDILKLTRYVKRLYTNPEGDRVILYVGYWQTQTGDYQAAKHSPALCLPANGWSIQFKPVRQVNIKNSDSVDTKRIVGEIRDTPYLFYYWFFSGEKNYTEEWQALINISFEKLFRGRSDGGIVEISIPIRGGDKIAGEERANEILEDFLEEFYPELRKLIHGSE